VPEWAVGALAEAAPAKVNLFLHVVGRRADGYHLLDSLAVFPAVGDVLRAEPDGILSLTIGGAFGGVLRAEPDNLVLRAARALAVAAAIAPGARLHLEKNLPVASGIGGGSADAAAALRLLARLWRVPPAEPALAAALGADVPVCLGAQPARMGGIGEVLRPAPAMPACGMVLVNPGMAVATPAIFAARRGDFSPPAALPAGWPDFAGFAAALARLGNDLEAPARLLCPPIGEVLAALGALPGCALARMSGSGATCFGLFAHAAAAEAAAAALRRTGWWCWGGPLAGLAAGSRAT
jgi:4-diphosphocytidyl-2-C-methyl-D-erythritol kinase